MRSRNWPTMNWPVPAMGDVFWSGPNPDEEEARRLAAQFRETLTKGQSARQGKGFISAEYAAAVTDEDLLEEARMCIAVRRKRYGV